MVILIFLCYMLLEISETQTERQKDRQTDDVKTITHVADVGCNNDIPVIQSNNVSESGDCSIYLCLVHIEFQ